MKLAELCPTWGDVRRLLEGLEAKGDLGALRIRRDIAQRTLRTFQESGRQPPEWLPPAAETSTALRQLESAESDRRRLEQRLATAETDVRQLRRSRCERTVDAAIRRGVVSRHAREAIVRQLEGGDIDLRTALDPYFTPPMPSDEDFAQQFEADHGEKPIVPGPPQTEEEAERRQLAAALGIREEEVI